MSDQMDTQGLTLYQPVPLLDLAAQSIAKNFSASDLDNHKEYLDEALMKKVVYHSFPQDIQCIEAFADMTGSRMLVDRGMKLVKEKRIKEMFQIGFMATAYLSKVNPTYYDLSYSSGRGSPGRPGLKLITDMNSCEEESGEIKVSILVEGQKIIKSTCSMCPPSCVWCEHVYAASIHRIKYPEKVPIYAPMTESLSSLSRDQLQKLLQYAVNEDPAGIMGKIFKHYNEIRDSNSEINKTDGAPDPSFWGLQGDGESQWDWTLGLLKSRFSRAIDEIHGRSLYDYDYGTINYTHPDNYDLILKMKQSKLFAFIAHVADFIRLKEYLSAAEIMRCFINTTIQKMRFTTRSGCPSLSRWWHDLSHIHALLVLRTEDKEARNVLLSVANEINATEVMRDHIIQTSDWSELPSLTNLFPAKAEKLSREGCMMIESVLANQLQPNPRDLCRLLDDTDNCENTSYNEDVIVGLMLARLESLFYFDKDHQKITRLGFLILHRLSILAQQFSILGQFVGSSSDKSDSGAPSSLIKLFCPGPPATSTKHEPEYLVSSSSSSVQPMNTDSVQESQKVSALDSDNRKVLVGFCLQALELSRYRMQAVVTDPNENINAAVVDPSSSQSETSMLTSNQSERPVISKPEYNWLKALEATVCKYLESVEAEDSHDAVSMYIDSIHNAGTSFYSFEHKDLLSIGGAFPLSLLNSVCQLFRKNDALKESKSKQLVKICSEILFDSTSCQVHKSLLDEELLQKLLMFTSTNSPHLFINNFKAILDKFCKDVDVKNFQLIIETFLSLIDTESSEDANLLNQMQNHLQNIRNTAMLTLISTILERGHCWRFKGNRRTIYSVLEEGIKFYEKVLGLSNPDAAPSSLSSALQTLGSDADYYTTGRVIEKDLIYLLFKKLGLSSLAIFSKVWQYIFTCKELQDLFLNLEKPINNENFHSQGEGAALTPELLFIIDEFYDSKLSHDEDACTLLTRFFTPGSDQYTKITRIIVNNAENYNTEALFYLAKLNLDVTWHSPVFNLDPNVAESVNSLQAVDDGFGNTIAAMDDKTFEIVEKAFERLGFIKPTSSILGAIDWVFNSCVMSESEDITRLQFYDKLILCVCNHAQYQPQIILKILQRIDVICGGIDSSYLAQHQSITDLRSALIKAYRQYFERWSGDCVLKEYDQIIAEMLKAKDECKKFVHNGDIEFDKVVVLSVRVMHSIKKHFYFQKLLNIAFPSDTKVNDG